MTCYLTLTPIAGELCAICRQPAVATYGDLAVCAEDYEALAGPDLSEEAEEPDPGPAETTEYQ